MKRQYRFDQTFIWDQSDLPDGMTLDHLGEEAHRQWLQIIEVLAKDNRRNSSFWYTQIASRNSSSLPFLYDLAMMLALERSSEFLTSYCFLLPSGARGRALAKCLRVRFPSIQFRIAKKTRIDGVISGLWQSNLPPLPTLRLWLGYWRAVVRPLFEARWHRRSAPPVPNEPVWILDTYVRLDSEGHPLADRYF
ncbi:MAG: hypothetical protein KDK37_14270, partial [Leptospiraceae bacterium]|nr:hypothetical protein [Leptospiraceae bacterium]